MTELGIELRKSIAKTTTYRVRTGNGKAGSVLGKKYQDTFPYTVVSDPKTVPQQANRGKFAAAMTAAKLLTPAERQPYIDRAKKQGSINWHNIFISEYMLT